MLLLVLSGCDQAAAEEGRETSFAMATDVSASANESDGALISHSAIPRGTAGIGVAYDPSEAGRTSVSRGVALAIRELNSRPGGHRFAARTSRPGVTSAVQSATELRDDDGVVGVVGHSESGASLNAIPVYEDVEHGGEHALVAVSPTATSPRLSGHSDWFFRVCPHDLAASNEVARFALDSLGARRAAIIYRNDSYGRDWTSAFVQTFEAGGGEIVQRDPYLSGITEWEAYAGYMRHREADVFLFPGSVEDAREAILAVRREGSSIPFIGGDAASALDADPEEYAGARYTAFFEAASTTSPMAVAFVEAFRAEYGEDPDQRAALSYDAALLIGEAVLAVGADRRRIRDWIAGVGTSRPALEGVAGPISFNEDHDQTDRRVIVASVRAP